MRKIKAIVVDLDRTLLRSDKTVSKYTAQTLKKCKDASIKIMIATARPLRDAMQFYKTLDFDAITVSNGARTVCGERVIECGISRESAQALLGELERYPNFRITLETGERAYSNKPIEDYETVLTDDLKGTAKSEGVLKILVHMDGDDVLPTVKKALTDDLHYTVAHGYMMQIMNKAATKWNGVLSMLGSVGVSPEETAYFGDDMDDAEPIKMCGVGVAVSNAADSIKAISDHVAKSNDEDGVARFIEDNVFM